MGSVIELAQQAFGGGISVDPTSAYGTLGDGTLTYVDELGDIQVIPDTQTPPYGEPPMVGPLDGDPDMGGDEFANPIFGPDVGGPTFGPIGDDTETIHEEIHGTAQPRGYAIEDWQNPSNPGIPNLGPINDQPAMTAATSARHHFQSDEQGWGLDPAILHPRFPHSENVFPGYGQAVRKRNGTLEVSSFDLPYGQFSAINWELQYQEMRRASSLHGRLFDTPTPVAYSDTVPVGGQAGPFNLIPEGDEGVY